jgi:hypothetical protein
MIPTRRLTSDSSPEQAFAARRGDRYLGDPTADSLQGEDQGPQYAYDAVSGPLGG